MELDVWECAWLIMIIEGLEEEGFKFDIKS